MRLGRYFDRYKVPQWAAHYIDYNAHKRTLKFVSHDVDATRAESVLSDLHTSLRRDSDKADAFYETQHAAIQRKIDILCARYGITLETFPHCCEGVDVDELHDLGAALCELRDAVLQVEWFRKVNRDGFEAIAAKIARLTAIRSDTVSNGQITRSKTSGWKGEGRREDACVQCATPLRVEESLRATKGVRQTEHEAQQTLELLDEAISGLDESVVGKAREGREVMACVPCAKSLRSSYLSNKPGHLDESTGDHHDIDGEHGTTYQSLGIRSACILMPSLGSADQIYLSILEDDPARLTRLLASESGVQQQTLSKEAATSYSNLLRFAISKRAIACAHLLIEGLQVTREPQDAPQHRYLHELIINIGRRKTPSCQSDTLSSQSITNRANGVVDSVQFFRAILEKLSSEHMHMLVERDDEGRLPIHYAAMYGLSEVYSLLSERMQSCELSPYGVEEILLVEDGEQLTPLHLAVIGGHPETVEAILAHHPKMRADDMSSEMPRDELLSSNVLEIALRLNRLEICYSLIAHGIGLAYRGAHDMTPLHTAATLGFTACVEILLAMGPRYNLKVDDCETLNGWTPLMFACVRGELDVVLPLLEAGANTKQRDFLGWTGIDHASLRGYVYITHALVAIDPSVIPPIEISNMINRSSRSRPIDVGYTQTNGHSSSKKQRSALRKSRVVVNLGSLGPNTEVDAVKLNKSSLCSRPDIPAGLAKFRLEVRSLYSSGNTYSYQLPILGGKVYEPCLFDLDDPDQAGLAFNIYHATSDPRVPEVLTASGVALLPNLRKCLGQQRESLVRYHTIPLLGTKSLDYAGTITFSFIVVRPLSHPNVGRMPAWQVPTSTNVVGHRGNGENMVSRKNLQLGENTIPSFQAAVNLGASAIETDVQLTKDLVPVLYHDFTVCETGLDAPMNTLSLDQFMHLNAVQLTESRAPSFGPQLLTEQGSSTPPQRSRANSLGSAQGSRASDLRKRMEQTFEFKLRGIKGNTLETAVRQPFVTLKELLTADIREDVALYIEIKYPMLTEATEEWYMDSYSIEVNLLVDTILTTIYNLAGARPIVLSSFSPEVCICLRLKQTDYPVMFLTESGHCKAGDVRATSVQEAVHFARSWDLAGTVQRTDPLLASPRLVGYCQRGGMQCASWGYANDEPDKAVRLAQSGLDAVIVNNVKMVAKALAELSSTNSEAGQ